MMQTLLFLTIWCVLGEIAIGMFRNIAPPLIEAPRRFDSSSKLERVEREWYKQMYELYMVLEKSRLNFILEILLALSLGPIWNVLWIITAYVERLLNHAYQKEAIQCKNYIIQHTIKELRK